MPGMGEFNWPDSDLPDDHPFREFFKRLGRPDRQDGGPKFGQPAPRQSLAQGSGFFISADGYLVTNQHVIAKGSDVEVSLDDGRTLAAKVVGTDPYTDLALLKVDGQDLPFVELAPQAPRVGDWVLAVGNPFGLGSTVTSGIVSAHARDLGAGPSDDFLQIDAPINHGSSGGPAFQSRGPGHRREHCHRSAVGRQCRRRFRDPSRDGPSRGRPAERQGRDRAGLSGRPN